MVLIGFGVSFQRRKKPGLGDYPGIRQQLAKSTVPIMLMKSITKDSYASIDQYCEWVEQGFYSAWKREASTIPYEAPDRTYCKIVSTLLKWVATG